MELKKPLISVGILFMLILHVEAKGGRGGGGSRSSSSSSRSSSSRSSSSSYSRPSTNSKPSTSYNFAAPRPSTSSAGFVAPKPSSSSAGFVTPKPLSSSAGFVTPKPSTSSAGFVTPKPSTSSAGFVTQKPASSSSPGFVQPQPPYNPSFNPSAPIQPSLNKPYPVQPHSTVYNNNYLPSTGAQQFQPPIYQQPYVTNVIHKNKYNTPIVPIIVPFGGTRTFHSTSHYGRHYGWDSSEERYGGGSNREINTVHHHYHSPSENRIIKTENFLQTPSEGIKYNVTLYQHSYFQGKSLGVSLGLGECVDIPRTFQIDVSSVKTNGNCIMLCEDKECTGVCKQFGKGSEDSGSYVGYLLNDRGSSILLCNPVQSSGIENFNSTGFQADGIPVITGSVIFPRAPENLERPLKPQEVSDQTSSTSDRDPPLFSVSDQAVNRESKFTTISDNKWRLISLKSDSGPAKMKHEITLNEHIFEEGKELTVLIEEGECMDFPHLFHKQVSNITTHDNCVALCTEMQCKGECRKFYGNGLFVGQYFNDLASSIALCPRDASDNQITVLSKPELAHAYNETVFTAGTPGNKVRATLYEHGYQKGHRIHVDIGENDKCINIPESFDDQTSSLDTNTNCITLCEHKNCSGECVSFGPNKNSEFWVEDFNDKASSMKLC